MGNHNIVSYLTRQGAEQPDAVAIVDMHMGVERTTTFAELQSKSVAVASTLQGYGLRHSDVVLVLHEVTADLYALLLALFRIGAVAMFVDVSASREELRHCFKISPPDAIIASAKGHLLELLLPHRAQSPMRFTTLPFMPGAASLFSAISKRDGGGASVNEPVQGPLPALIPPTQPALITFTSGSTGLPKAIVRTHEFLSAQLEALKDSLTLAKGKTEMTNLPVFVLANIASGMTSIIPHGNLRKPSRIDPSPLIRQLEKHAVSRITASPALLERLILGCQRCQRKGRALNSISSLTEIYTGGGPVFPSLLRKLRNAFPNARIVTVYGSTEAEPISHTSFDELGPHDLNATECGGGLLVGVPEASVAVAILDFAATSAEMTPAEFGSYRRPPGQAGEIVVTGKAVIKGYLDGVGDEETKIAVGSEIWHRTGDAGYCDAQGRLWLLGRASARISDSRGTVFPFQIEHLGDAGDQKFACVSTGDKRTLFVEAGSFSNYLIPSLRRHRLSQCIRQLQGRLEYDRIVMLPKLPIDRRHNSKIAYARLELIANQALPKDVSESFSFASSSFWALLTQRLSVRSRSSMVNGLAR